MESEKLKIKCPKCKSTLLKRVGILTLRVGITIHEFECSKCHTKFNN